MSKIWISIDGGGTKTCICACGKSKNIIYKETFGAANYKSASVEEVRKNLSFGIGKMMNKLGLSSENIAGAIMGLSGCDTKYDYDIYASIISDTGIPLERTYICNDTELVYRGLSDGEGLCVIAGTGSIVCIYDKNGLKGRVGGWGSHLSDEGSGYWIGAEIIRRMIRSLDGLEEYKTEIFKRIRKEYLKNCENCQWKLANLSVAEIASIALWVFKGAAAGDIVCSEIIETSADKISELIIAAGKKGAFKDEINIVASGSLFSDIAYREKIRLRVSGGLCDKSLRFLYPRLSPAAEGLRFAMNRFV